MGLNIKKEGVQLDTSVLFATMAHEPDRTEFLAVSEALGEQLLFKGDDFAHTDVTPALCVWRSAASEESP